MSCEHLYRRRLTLQVAGGKGNPDSRDEYGMAGLV
jgi:hypothetical protein